MQQHITNCLVGPVRGTRGWWTQLGGADALPPADAPVKERKPRRKKKPLSAEALDPAIRADLVARVRQEIAAGTYDTQEKWDLALDRLLDRLGRE